MKVYLHGGGVQYDMASNLQRGSVNFLPLVGNFTPEFVDDQLFALHLLSLHMRFLQQTLRGVVHVLDKREPRTGS